MVTEQIIKVFISKTFSPCDLDMQWTETITEEGHITFIRIIPAKFGQNPASNLGGLCPFKQVLMTDIQQSQYIEP